MYRRLKYTVLGIKYKRLERTGHRRLHSPGLHLPVVERVVHLLLHSGLLEKGVGRRDVLLVACVQKYKVYLYGRGNRARHPQPRASALAAGTTPLDSASNCTLSSVASRPTASS